LRFNLPQPGVSIIRAAPHLAENAEYHAAQELQEANESRIAELEDKLARAEVIDITKLSGDTSNLAPRSP
jgi:transcription elongation factor GreA